MRFLDLEGCRAWAREHKIALAGTGFPVGVADLTLPVIRFDFPSSAHRTTWFSQYLSAALPGASENLLWVTGWGIWPSSENWHLYRHLRQSYGDRNSLEQAPGHWFTNAERDDLATFLQIGIICGWDMSLFADPDRARLLISHDEFVVMSSADEGLLESCRATLTSAGIAVLNEASA